MNEEKKIVKHEKKIKHFMENYAILYLNFQEQFFNV